MPNRNYLAGRATEYQRMEAWRTKGYTVSRTASSHGPFDLYALKSGRSVECIQVKRVSTIAEAKRLLEGFRKNPPFPPSPHFHQVMEVKVKGSTEVESVTI